MLSSFSAVRSASMPTRLSVPDLADHLDRNGAADRGSEIEPEPRAARVIERRLQLDIGIALVRLAIIERGRLPVDLDVALDLIALIVGDDLQRVGFELLVHHQLVGGKPAEIGRDGVGGVGLGQFALDRHAERDDGGNRPLARIGIDQGAGKFAEAVGGEDFGRRRHRAVDPELDPRRRRLRRHVRHLEHKIRNVELAARRRVGRCLPDRHRGRAPGDMRLQIGIAHRRQIIDRMQRRRPMRRC